VVSRKQKAASWASQKVPITVLAGVAAFSDERHCQPFLSLSRLEATIWFDVPARLPRYARLPNTLGPSAKRGAKVIAATAEKLAAGRQLHSSQSAGASP